MASSFATVNGIRLHYVAAGKGSPVLLLPGWAETWWAYLRAAIGIQDSLKDRKADAPRGSAWRSEWRCTKGMSSSKTVTS